MREQTINISGLRSKTRQVITQVHSRGQSFVVEILGEPVAAIVGLDEYQEFLKLKRARAARQRRFALIRQVARRNALTEAEAMALAQKAQ